MTKEKEILPVSEDSKPETLVVDKKQLEEIISRLGKVEEENIKLNAVADKSRLEWFNNKQPKKGVTTFRLSTFDGKIITSWRMIKDVVEKNISTGIYYEHQEYEIILEDGTKQNIVGYNKFANVQYASQVVAEEVSRTSTDESITLTLKVVGQDKTVVIDSKFVN